MVTRGDLSYRRSPVERRRGPSFYSPSSSDSECLARSSTIISSSFVVEQKLLPTLSCDRTKFVPSSNTGSRRKFQHISSYENQLAAGDCSALRWDDKFYVPVVGSAWMVTDLNDVGRTVVENEKNQNSLQNFEQDRDRAPCRRSVPRCCRVSDLLSVNFPQLDFTTTRKLDLQ